MEAPYLDTLKATLNTQNNLLLLLQKRVEYLEAEIENCPSEHYHINEARINIIKTQAEIDTLKKVIAEKTAYFEKFAAHFEIEYADMEKKYDKLIENAYLRASKNPVLKNIIDSVNKDVLKTDKEAKLLFYKQVKQHLI
jgi:hypothetical protein